MVCAAGDLTHFLAFSAGTKCDSATAILNTLFVENDPFSCVTPSSGPLSWVALGTDEDSCNVEVAKLNALLYPQHANGPVKCSLNFLDALSPDSATSCDVTVDKLNCKLAGGTYEYDGHSSNCAPSAADKLVGYRVCSTPEETCAAELGLRDLTASECVQAAATLYGKELAYPDLHVALYPLQRGCWDDGLGHGRVFYNTAPDRPNRTHTVEDDNPLRVCGEFEAASSTSTSITRALATPTRTTTSVAPTSLRPFATIGVGGNSTIVGYAQLSSRNQTCSSKLGMQDLTASQCVDAVKTLFSKDVVNPDGLVYKGLPHGCFNRGDGNFFFNTGGATGGVPANSMGEPLCVCGVTATASTTTKATTQHYQPATAADRRFTPQPSHKSDSDSNFTKIGHLPATLLPKGQVVVYDLRVSGVDGYPVACPTATELNSEALANTLVKPGAQAAFREGLVSMDVMPSPAVSWIILLCTVDADSLSSPSICDTTLGKIVDYGWTETDSLYLWNSSQVQPYYSPTGTLNVSLVTAVNFHGQSTEMVNGAFNPLSIRAIQDLSKQMFLDKVCQDFVGDGNTGAGAGKNVSSATTSTTITAATAAVSTTTTTATTATTTTTWYPMQRPNDVVVLDLRFDNDESPATDWSSSCGTKYPYPAAIADIVQEHSTSMFSIKLTHMIKEQSISANIRPSDRLLVILICSDQTLAPLVYELPNRLVCTAAENALASLGFAVADEWEPNVEDSGAGAMQISTVASVILHQDGGSSNRETLARDGINLMCAIDRHKVAGASTTSAPATSSTLLGVLSRCDPRNDHCDEKEDLYCDPKEYECRYVDVPVRTTAPQGSARTAATHGPGLGAVDTTTTSASRSTAARETSTIHRVKPTATTPAAPITPEETAKSHTIKEFIYWCVGSLVFGMVVGVVILFRHKCPVFRRRGEVGNAGGAYHNRAFGEYVELQQQDPGMSDDTETDDHTDHNTTDDELLNEAGDFNDYSDEARLLDLDHTADNVIDDSDTPDTIEPVVDRSRGYHDHEHRRSRRRDRVQPRANAFNNQAGGRQEDSF